MVLKDGDIIEHIDDCSSPKQMAGNAGQKKTIGKDIDLYYAKRLLKGGRVKLISPAKPTVVASSKPEEKK